MDFQTKQWLIGIIILFIIIILIDGIRRMRRAKRDSIQMSLNVEKNQQGNIPEYGSEFPNGGARTSKSQIDKERIEKIKNQYDFGRDFSIDNDEDLNENSYEEFEEEQVPIDEQDQWLDTDDDDYYTNKWDEGIEGESTVTTSIVTENAVTKSAVTESSVEKNTVEKSTIENEGTVAETNVPAKAEIEIPPVEQPIAAQDEDKEPQRTNEPAIATKNESPRPEAPTQTTLDLEEPVPVLMDSVDEVESSIVEPQPIPEPTISADRPRNEAENIRPVGKHVKAQIEPVIGDTENLDTHSANKPRYKSKYFASETQQKKSSEPKEVLVINIQAPKGQQFAGSDLLEQVLENGLRFGAMDIFHRHLEEDGEGPVLFSMANILAPGVFDLKTIDSFMTPGVTLFLTLPVAEGSNMDAFDLMLKAAKQMATELRGDLKDEQRSVMTVQTMEHYRERIRDFSRRQQLEKNR